MPRNSYVRNTVRVLKVFSPTDQRRLLKITGEHAKGYRDHVIISLALGTGLREHEIVALTVGDVCRGPAEIRPRIHLSVYKGRTRASGGPIPAAQAVFVSKTLQRKLKQFMKWKESRGQSIKPSAPLFNPWDHPVKMSTRALRAMFARWQKAAGIDPPLPFHSLRHACLTNLYTATKNLRLVQRAARHASISSTEIYTHVTDEDVRRAVDELPV